MHKEYVLARLEQLYGDYLRTINKLERDRKPGEGLFGTRGPKNDPCHDRFAEELGAFLEELAASEADSSVRRASMETIFSAPLQNREPKSAFWMLIAVQGLTRGLISGLTPEDAAALAERYAEDYPRNARLPVQIEILDLLRTAAGETTAAPRRGLFRKRR